MNTTTFNPYRRMLVILLAISLFIAVVGMACDEGPTPDNAYGITSPVSELETKVMEMVQPEQDNVLSGGN